MRQASDIVKVNDSLTLVIADENLTSDGVSRVGCVASAFSLCGGNYAGLPISGISDAILDHFWNLND
jgi:hypothetical protein